MTRPGLAYVVIGPDPEDGFHDPAKGDCPDGDRYVTPATARTLGFEACEECFNT